MGVADLLFQKRKELAENNLKEGKLFMEENAKLEGVVTLGSGLQYKVIKQGIGKKPRISDSVKCHYHGTNLKGEIFDSSVNRGVPATFSLQKVISGWT